MVGFAAFVRSHRADYVNSTRHVDTLASSMSDEERDDIETSCNEFIKTCFGRIAALERQHAADLPRKHGGGAAGPRTGGGGTSSNNNNGARSGHYRGVVDYLYERLRALAKVVESMTAIRLRQALTERRRLAMADRDAKAGAGGGTVSNPPAAMLGGGGRSSGSSSSRSSRSSSRGGIMGGRQDGDGGGDGDDDDFSDEEELARENALLQRRLENDLDEVKRIETKMAEVAEVMQMFSAELTKQHDSIMQLEENADKSQQEIVKANRKLTSANEHKRGGRHFTVMVLVTASFVLLFLHWFAD
eukprot:g4298.t1